MVNVVLAALIPGVALGISRLGLGGGIFKPKQPRAIPDPPPFTEEEIFGPAPVATKPPTPAPLPSSWQEPDVLTKAPPAPPPPPPLPEEMPEDVAPMPVPSAPPMTSPAHIDVPEAPTSAPPVTSQDDARARLDAMRAELQAIIDNPSAENLARLRDPNNRAAMELALTMIERGGYTELAARIRSLMMQLPTRQDIEATAPPVSVIVPNPPPVPGPSATPSEPQVTIHDAVIEPVEPATATPAPVADQPPAGYDPAKARKIAAQVNSNIANNKYSYSRKLVTDFQRFAGINADGVYGGATRAALAHFGVRRPTPALFQPLADQPYPWA